MRKRNEEIRCSISKANLMMHEVAEGLGVSESTFYRWLRSEMPDEKKKEVLAAIDQIKQELVKVQ